MQDKKGHPQTTLIILWGREDEGGGGGGDQKAKNNYFAFKNQLYFRKGETKTNRVVYECHKMYEVRKLGLVRLDLL